MRERLKRTLPCVLRLFMLVLFCAAIPAYAQDASGNPANWCRNGLFTSESKEFRLAHVRGARGSRVYLYGDDEGCPGPAAKCRQKAYVIPGDELIVSRAFGEYVCAWYQPARGSETVGWMAASQLEISEADANPAAALWLGSWEFYNNSLLITRGAKAGMLRVEGEAFWHGVNPENVHTGEVGGEAAPAAGVLRLDDDICRATFRLVGPYLIVDDNGDCGGANVTFDGVYRKKK
jgi:hypothetical protein